MERIEETLGVAADPQAERGQGWPAPRYFLISSRTVMPDGIIGNTCS